MKMCVMCSGPLRSIRRFVSDGILYVSYRCARCDMTQQDLASQDGRDHPRLVLSHTDAYSRRHDSRSAAAQTQKRIRDIS